MSYLSGADRATVCRMILEGKAEEAFAQFRVSDLDQVLLRRRAHEAVRKASARDMPFSRYFQARIANPALKIVVTAMAITAAP